MINHVFLKNEGEEVPVKFLERALQSNPDGWGIAVPSDKGMEVKAFPVDKNTLGTLTHLLNDEDCLRNRFAMVQFSKVHDKTKNNLSNYGPFKAYDKGGRILFAGAGFGSTKDKDKEMSADHYLVSKLVRTNIAGMLAEGIPVDGIVNQEALKEFIRDQITDTGCCVILDNDSYYCFVAGDKLSHRDYNWGWSSRDLGKFDNVKTEEAPEAKPPVQKIKPPVVEQEELELTRKPRLRLNRGVSLNRGQGSSRILVEPPKPRESAIIKGPKSDTISPQMKAATKDIATTIPDKQIEKVMDMSIKYRGPGDKLMPSMQEVRKMIEEIPDFKQQTACDPIEFLYHPNKSLKDLHEQCPQAFYELAMAWRARLLDQHHDALGGQPRQLEKRSVAA